ncbi:MAG: hypothetical protein RL015_1498 [Verrucomicrobiota bacterium]
MTVEEWWLSLRHHRQSQSKALPLSDAKGGSFAWFLTDRMLLILHKLDMGAGGHRFNASPSHESCDP